MITRRTPDGVGDGVVIRGFTLIELLVVVAIIALLLSILLPSLSGAREQAKQVQCGSNLSGIGKGVEMCKLENRGHTPHWDDGETPDIGHQEFLLSWADLLYDLDYLSSDDVYVCPSDKRPDELTRAQAVDWVFRYVNDMGVGEQPKWGVRTSYAASAITCYSFPGDRYKDPARQVYAMDGYWSWFWNLNAYWFYSSKFAAANGDHMSSLDWGDPWVGWRHGNRHSAMTLFFDSHVAPITPKVPKRPFDLRRAVDTTEYFTWLPGESNMRRLGAAYQGEVWDWVLEQRKPAHETEPGSTGPDPGDNKHPHDYPFVKLDPEMRTIKGAWRKFPSNWRERR